MRALAVIVVLGVVVSGLGLGLGGCYSPAPPAGAYRCGVDSACPGGQHCVCGLCVSRDAQAACSFTLKADASGGVAEHQPFALTVRALGADGKTLAGEFQGAVTLDASWGDVRPATVPLHAGTATVMVTLNRETLPPQAAIIDATFAAAHGKSNKVTVTAPTFTRDALATVTPPSLAQPFGYANLVVAEPDVVALPAGGYRMYFTSVALEGGSLHYGLGVAGSSDGRHFTPPDAPLLEAAGGRVGAPDLFSIGERSYLAYGSITGASGKSPSAIQLAAATDGLGPFSPLIHPTLSRSDCSFCASVSSPWVIRDPTPGSDNADGNGYVLFFAGGQPGDPSAGTATTVAIGRASSPDGLTYAAEPAPILSGDRGNEAQLYAPRVMIDGSVWKMWYAYGTQSVTDPCLPANQVQIGYATSNDGFYWVRSPSNPVISTSQSGAGWDAGEHVVIPGSVMPLDGKDPASGVALYYTLLKRVSLTGDPQGATVCSPSGIGRAIRP